MIVQTARLSQTFLSTPSARRATTYCVTDFYRIYISIHALREEGDVTCQVIFDNSINFYPRPPRGGRLDLLGLLNAGVIISIHALREEGDMPSSTSSPMCWHDFYPRPPRGGRLPTAAMFRNLLAFLSTPSARRATRRNEAYRWLSEFLSTPSARRATTYCVTDFYRIYISIHALREEGDGH